MPDDAHLPQTQSLPDLSLSASPPTSSTELESYYSRTDTKTARQPVRYEKPGTTGQEVRERRELDEDVEEIDFGYSPSSPERDREGSNPRLNSAGSRSTMDHGGFGRRDHRLETRQSFTKLDSTTRITAKQTSTPQLEREHDNSMHQRGRRDSSSSARSDSTSSSLGSIHSAPELLQIVQLQQSPVLAPTPSPDPPPLRPLPQTEPPPELRRNASSQRSMQSRAKRQSIAVMEHRNFNELDETRHERSQQTRPVQHGDEEAEGEPLAGTWEADKSLKRRRRKREFPNTLWEYFKQEVLTVEVDGAEGIKSERVVNFLTVPKELEKIIFFGFIICLDSFLYTFTILPLRAVSAFTSLITNHASACLRWDSRARSLKLSQKCDLIKAVIVGITVVSLHRVTDASKMYHGVRGQETIKLYVLFNVLEIADRLCCSFGQDLSDSLFSTSALSANVSSRRFLRVFPPLQPLFLFTLYTLYVISHSLVLFYQLVTLNVAVNSYSNALLTLLLSNQFVEIKGSVFKKFEKENLFQMTCADIVERFQLAIMLFIISLRNLLELSTSIPTTTTTTSGTNFTSTMSSASTSLLPTPALLLTTFSPALTVLISECFVDWLKHAFITKFNHIRPEIYGRYMDVLCKDLTKGQAGISTTHSQSSSSSLIDQSPSVSRRLGFASLPLSCLVIRVFFQAFRLLGDESGLDECLLPTTTPTTPPDLLVHLSSSRSEGLQSSLLSFLGEWRGKTVVEKGFEEMAKWVGVVAVALGFWLCLILLKLLIGINLRTFALERWNGVEKLEREEEDDKNGRFRNGIGVSKSEAYETEKTNKLLKDKAFDQPGKPGSGNGGKDKLALEDIGRYDMVRSRLW